ncbi:hypothetical protein ACOACO_13855 [Nocardioides sp. CPCC 205120]|uniref:hypothetical protein n=1 Tax=Nocardioides sp. CPCC 205120 TaxID=3406462 RepID=UPI003B509F9A
MRRVAASPALLLALLLTVVLAAGCVRLPDSGEVTVPTERPGQGATAGLDYVPPGPTPGESPDEIVAHFLGAMRATSRQTSVARSFLTEEAAGSWAPEDRTIVYEDLGRPTGGSRVTTRLEGVAELDARGQWVDDPASASRTLTFELAPEDGEWRIATLPDALVVPRSWFEARYQPVDLYFLDPSGRILVPTPVFLPAGSQLPARTVAALLQGPPPGSEGVVTTALGAAAHPGLSVEVSATGVADVRLPSDAETGDDGNGATGGNRDDAEGTGGAGGTGGTGAGTFADGLSEAMVAQLAWTLRQLPSVARVRVSVDGVPLRVPDGEDSFAVGAGERFGPGAVGADPDLFALTPEGAVVRVRERRVQPVPGTEALQAAGVRTLSVNLYGDRVAGQAGDRVLLTSLDEPDTPPVEVAAAGEAVLAWDFADRTWVLDGGDRARVRVVNQGSVEAVSVPGVTGERATRLLVSRDGSRLVAVVGEPGEQRVVVARVRYDERGGVVGVLPATAVLDLGREGAADPGTTDAGTAAPATTGVVRDVGWRSPTGLVVLTGLGDDLVELRQLPVDGAPVATSAATLLVTTAQRLVASSAPGSDLLLVGPGGVEAYDGERITGVDAVPDVAALTYVG